MPMPMVVHVTKRLVLMLNAEANKYTAVLEWTIQNGCPYCAGGAAQEDLDR
jgi:hypothetical protein